MKIKPDGNRDDLRPEYHLDYSKAVRGKYYKRPLQEGTNIVVLKPDVARAFGDSAAVNEALRSLARHLLLDATAGKTFRRTQGKNCAWRETQGTAPEVTIDTAGNPIPFFSARLLQLRLAGEYGWFYD
jgi:hypothetical protein